MTEELEKDYWKTRCRALADKLRHYVRKGVQVAKLREDKRELLSILQDKDTRIAQLAKRNVRLLEILQDRDKEMKELRLSVAQITEPVIDEVLEQEARDWIRHNHELVDRSDFHDEIEYDHARVDDLVEVYVTAVKAHMKKEQVDEVR